MKIKRKKRRWIKRNLIGLISLFVLVVAVICSAIFPGVFWSRIYSSLAYDPAWDIPPLPKEEMIELQEIFGQTFYYHGDDHKCYSFVSEDSQYVIKFFKMHQLVAKNWLNYIPIPKILDAYRFEKVDKRHLKLLDVFASCKLAYQEMKEETGLLYLHLNKTRDLKTSVRLVRSIGSERRIDLDSVSFVVQKNGIPFMQKLQSYIDKNDKVGVERALTQLIELIKLRESKRIVDIPQNRQDIVGHYGFVGRTCIYLDITNFHKALDLQTIESEFLKTTESIKNWCYSHCSILEQSLLAQILEPID